MSNRNSLQYKAVLNHLEALTTALRVTPGAESSLRLKFQELSWLPIGAEASANELVPLALNRIENDTSDYEMFINILRNITGMEQLVNTITGKLLSFCLFSEAVITYSTLFSVLCGTLHN